MNQEKVDEVRKGLLYLAGEFVKDADRADRNGRTDDTRLYAHAAAECFTAAMLPAPTVAP